MDRIFRFRQIDKTIVFVSHGLETVRTLCDQAVWLDHGVARRVGPAGEVVDDYLAEVNRREQEQIAEHSGGVADGSELHRRGTREIEIVQVELLGADGRAHRVFHTHDSLTIRMHYVAHQPIVRPVFGVGVHHESGFWLSGPNTRFAGVDIPAVAGTGYVDYTITDLTLLSGRYLISVAAYDDAMLHPYDHHDRLYRLFVQSEGLRERFGVLAVSDRWAWRQEQQIPEQQSLSVK
jgi:lipopolysaccharide transport system ATP-binding protein